MLPFPLEPARRTADEDYDQDELNEFGKPQGVAQEDDWPVQNMPADQLIAIPFQQCFAFRMEYRHPSGVDHIAVFHRYR